MVCNINPCAIIAEYNPFHNGHLYHISKTRQVLGEIPIICVMSGSFTQRGEPAIFDKWVRAKWAIKNGCDLVIELPTIYAIQSANRFAGGAINIIKGLGCVKNISFGCETDNMEMLKKVADYKCSDEYSFRLNTALKNGNSFARAHQIAISKLEVDNTLLFDNPNCILAIEYLTHLKNTGITPIAIKRTGAPHNSNKLLCGITSATSIRKAIEKNNIDFQGNVPLNIYNDIKNLSPIALEEYFSIILSRIFYLKTDGLREIHDITEGLEHRIYEAAVNAKSLTELLEAVKTKRYLYTRLQRIMLYILLDITKDFMQKIDNEQLPVYARLLAINTSKTSPLSELSPSIPIISKAADYVNNLTPLQKQIFDKDVLATNMYSIFSNLRPNEDFVHKIIKQ